MSRDSDPEGPRRLVRSGPNLTPVVVLVVLLGVAAGGWWLYGRPVEQPAPAPVAVAPEPVAPPAPPPLPPLEERDATVRKLVSTLSSAPELARWLMAEDLVRRFVTSVVNIAEGDSPAPQLRGVLPYGEHDAIKRRGKLVANPRSFKAYDVVVEVLTSFDSAATAKVYRALEPLFDSAYHEIAPPGAHFSDTMARAIDRLTSTPVPDDIALVKAGPFFAYADPKLEELSRAQKQLLRLGPKNARQIQQKLRDLAIALELKLPTSAAR